MARRKFAGKREILPDPKYSSTEVSKFVNCLMERGKKSLAQGIFYRSMDILAEKTKDDPMSIFKKALTNVRPTLEVRPRRVGGATYQIPMEVPLQRSFHLGSKWLIQSARARKGMPMARKLTEEFLEAAKGEGPSVKKREEMHKMAEANRAFAHFRW